MIASKMETGGSVNLKIYGSLSALFLKNNVKFWCVFIFSIAFAACYPLKIRCGEIKIPTVPFLSNDSSSIPVSYIHN